MGVLEKLWGHIRRDEGGLNPDGINKMLQHVYTRGAWNTIPNPSSTRSWKCNSMGHHWMKYLKEGIVARHTYLTIQMWPIPNMPKTNSQLHDDIFMDSLAVDHGDEDIAL